MPARQDAADRPRRVVARVVTGGQTGVDRAATDVAIAHGVPYGGWVPIGGWAEDCVVPPGLLARYPEFQVTMTADPADRTARNVAVADASLVLVLSDAPSPGTALTRRCASALGVPWAVVDLTSPTSEAQLGPLLASIAPRSTLNVAGPRESEQPGIYAAATSFLLEHLVPRFWR
jgi:Circularly permutated YpsA SLOG family